MPKDIVKLEHNLQKRADKLGLKGDRAKAYIYGTATKVKKRKIEKEVAAGADPAEAHAKYFHRRKTHGSAQGKLQQSRNVWAKV